MIFSTKQRLFVPSRCRIIMDLWQNVPVVVFIWWKWICTLFFQISHWSFTVVFAAAWQKLFHDCLIPWFKWDGGGIHRLHFGQKLYQAAHSRDVRYTTDKDHVQFSKQITPCRQWVVFYSVARSAKVKIQESRKNETSSLNKPSDSGGSNGPVLKHKNCKVMKTFPLKSNSVDCPPAHKISGLMPLQAESWLCCLFRF